MKNRKTQLRNVFPTQVVHVILAYAYIFGGKCNKKKTRYAASHLWSTWKQLDTMDLMQRIFDDDTYEIYNVKNQLTVLLHAPNAYMILSPEIWITNKPFHLIITNQVISLLTYEDIISCGGFFVLGAYENYKHYDIYDVFQHKILFRLQNIMSQSRVLHLV